MSDVDAVVIGAGVVGLATARALARAGLSVFILEAEAHFGSQTSARNSEVIHAGLYYPPGSLKARTCVAGRRALYAYCTEKGIDHRQCGKLVVAVGPGQVAEVERLAANAAQNGVEDLRVLNAAETLALEPDINAAGALFSPTTGVIDSHAYMLALLGDAEAAGARLVCNSKVERIGQEGEDWAVHVQGTPEPILRTRRVVNAAGLQAQELSHAVEGMPAASIPRQVLAKGSYVTYSGRVPFRHLIYPVPEPGGLGVHVTMDVGGGAKFGPNVEWVERIDYEVAADLPERFAPGIASWWPGLDPARLAPGYAGVRPKLTGVGEPMADFVVAGPGDHGLPGFVALYGIESPGLTASLSLAEHVLAAFGDL